MNQFKEYMNPDAGGWLDFETIEEMFPFKDEHGRYRFPKTPQEMKKEVDAMSSIKRDELRKYFVSEFMNAVDEKYGHSTVNLSDIYDFSVDYTGGNL